MKKQIHLYASLGNLKKTAAGGGQTSARRLVKVLSGLGYDVQTVNRIIPAYTTESLFDKLHKGLGYFIDPIRYFIHLLFKSRGKGAAFVIGYGGGLFPFYFLFVRIGKLLGYKTILYVKGSFTKDKYKSFSNYLKSSFSDGLKKVDLALFEGKDGQEITSQVCPSTKSVWLPNYIETNFMPSGVAKRPTDHINLMYFGRLDPGKNILLIIDAFDLICKKYNNVYLNIVGSGEKEYTRMVYDRIEQSPNKEKIVTKPRIEHEKLKEFLPLQHFFMFPTESEGHSNALTEAMAYGVVPIASNRGFNLAVVGEDSIIVDDMTAMAYVDKLTKVIESGNFSNLSKAMFERVQHNFTQSVVENKLKGIIDHLSD